MIGLEQLLIYQIFKMLELCRYFISLLISLAMFFLIFLPVFFVNPINSHAKSQPNLHINSNSLTIDQTTQKAQFTGDVIVLFDNMILKTSLLEIIYKIVGKERTIDYIIIPTKLTAIREKTQETVIADSAEYSMSKKQLVLLGNIIMQKQDNIIKTNKLVYHTDLQSIEKK